MSALKVSVVGGSIGGLSAGVALHSLGIDVDVYERGAETLTSRGAGIVVQPELLKLIDGSGEVALPVTSCSHRRTVNAQGRQLSFNAMPQEFTSWESIYRSLRTLLPSKRYHLGAELTDCLQETGKVSLQFAGGALLKSDLLIIADGAHSKMRQRLGFQSIATYAGYVAWRGTLPEHLLPAELVEFFDDAFVFCEAGDGGHALAYFIPGDAAVTDKGARRLNWVWYETIPKGDRLDAILTDRNGHPHKSSVPPGGMNESSVLALRATASRLLAPQFAEIVDLTAEPFLQLIEDRATNRMMDGRAALLGDAAFVVRPHTAAAAAKAAGDAMSLANAVHRYPADIDQALRIYDGQRLPVGLSLTDYGVALGRRSVTT